MRTVDRDLDRVLARLRQAILERGYTQLEVQEVLGWGRSYISQLLTKQKSLRVEQILQILNVIDFDPADFFGEIYQFGKFAETRPGRGARRAAPVPLDTADGDTLLDDLRCARNLLDELVIALMDKNLITSDDLDRAAEKFRRN